MIQKYFSVDKYVEIFVEIQTEIDVKRKFANITKQTQKKKLNKPHFRYDYLLYYENYEKCAVNYYFFVQFLLIN